MIIEPNIYDEIAEFMTDMDPVKVLSFRVSIQLRKRMDTLLEKQQIENLSEEEKREVEHYLVINNIISLAKARARRVLAHEPSLS